LPLVHRDNFQGDFWAIAPGIFGSTKLSNSALSGMGGGVGVTQNQYRLSGEPI
jgi:hypothetical protein